MTTSKKYGAIATLSAIMSIRMLGLFMILPVFSVYAMHLAHATPFLIGLTLGIYGLAQALLQIPFGIASDYVGRKKIIFVGLMILCLGSVIAALSHSIFGILIGRALQGAGAIGSTVLALVADLTPENSRGKAMAMIGLAIGLAFTIAMITGPIITAHFQLKGIFWITSLLAIVGLLLLFTLPTPQKTVKTSENFRQKFSSVLKNTQLLRLNISIFSLHSILTALFIAMPILLVHTLHISPHAQIKFYIFVLLAAFLIALPLIGYVESKQKNKLFLLYAIGLLFLTTSLLSILHHTLWTVGILLFIFFTAFTFLEAILPSWVSKIVPANSKGAAMGAYSASQFLGIFFGGIIGGWIFSTHHLAYLFWFCAAVAVVWFCVAIHLVQCEKKIHNPELRNANEASNLAT